MRVLFVVPYPEHQAPSQRLKFEQYYRHFRNAGMIVEHRSFMSLAFWNIVYRKGHFVQKVYHTLAGYARRFLDLFRLRRYDVVYVHLWVTPFGPPIFEWLYRKRARAMVYDIDDLVYLSEAKSRANGLIAALKGRKKPIYLMKVSDHVITCTPYLDEFVRQYNDRTTDISSTINTDLYCPPANYSLKGDELVLGWSGSHSTSRYLNLLKPVFRRLQQDGIRFRLIVLGDPDFQMEDIRVDAIPWKEENEVDMISRFDIGLYPLPEEPWVYGKSGLKALQYMAAGVPTIATAIGANFRIIADGESGYLVKTMDEWYDRIRSLAADPLLRERIGRKGAEIVNAEYSVRANRTTYQRILESLGQRHRKDNATVKNHS